MARRRLQIKGHVFRDGNLWKLRYREDVIGEDGKVRRARPTRTLGFCTGPYAMTEKGAHRKAWDDWLSKLDQAQMCPQSIMSVHDFVGRYFRPEHVRLKKPAGQIHYETMFKHILPDLGKVRLCDVNLGEVQRLLSDKLSERYELGKASKRTGTYSVQTVRHIRNVISAIFEHAKRRGMYSGENPARYAKLPEMQRRELHALSWEQMQALLASLPSPAREVALFAVLTSMNIAELCGLQWKRMNLSDGWATVDGEALPPWTIAVRRQWYRNAYGSVKAKSRRRFLPISPMMAAELEGVRAHSNFTGPDDPVFASKTGRPMDEHNVAKRTLKKIGGKLGMPWLSWHAFRRTHTTLADQLDMTAGDRMAMMGHADLRMTAHYTQVDLERRRAIVERMAEKLLKKPAESELREMKPVSEAAQ